MSNLVKNFILLLIMISITALLFTSCRVVTPSSLEVYNDKVKKK